ncbi:uncharacterized protein DSM5745_06053 [Aspergillus mulundensis]|uniref:Uncharacterized protein n=1 Tax=Aspergillus mulundensis TaxID=1810919 RepID=A0A3D8RZD8_9EURO|nr:hypothetical protein DSM5745_06053 [Aspergillus mulundensis]RDW79201.1 hypothetical protein DSM5745_06053 [Aspergillus mulundensis]
MVLWRKVNNLVDLLGHASSIQRLTLKFRSKKRYTWTERDGKDRTSVYFARWPWPFRYGAPFPYRLKFWIARNPYDHEAVFLPFCRLRNIEAMYMDFRWKGALDPATNMDWSLHKFVIEHLTLKNRRLLCQKCKELGDPILGILPRLISEIDHRYMHTEGELPGYTAYRNFKSSANWPRRKKESRKEMMKDAQFESKHGQGHWVWPDFIPTESCPCRAPRDKE